jgi:glutathione synthase/RimK-type ligase-like ATP-grasp enzyme
VTRRIAIATCDPLLPAGDAGDDALVVACNDRDIDVDIRSWSDGQVDWSSYALTVIRSTWDYTTRREEFLRWLSAVPNLHNPASVVAPNTDKTYLRSLAAAGLPIVPTQFIEPGERADLPRSGQFVVKPSVGAGSRGAGRFDASHPGDLARADEHVASLHAAGRTVLVQPYLADVDAAGETGLIFIDGVFSHAIRKGPMLSDGVAHDVDGPALFVTESIAARSPDAAERAVAERFVAHLNAKAGGPLLYARIDLLPSEAGPVLIEAELTEPSLFLDHAAGSAERMAEAISSRLADAP